MASASDVIITSHEEKLTLEDFQLWSTNEGIFKSAKEEK